MSTQGKQSDFIPAKTVCEPVSDPRTLKDRLSQHPHDELSQERLVEYYKNNGLLEDLMELMLTRAEHATNSNEAARLLCVAAKECVEHKKHDHAFDIYALAFKRDPRDGAIQDMLDNLVQLTGRIEDIRELYETVCDDSKDRALVGVLSLRLTCLFVLQNNFKKADQHLAKVVCAEDIDALSILNKCSLVATRVEDQMYLSKVCNQVGEGGEARNVLVRALHMDLADGQEVTLHQLIGAQYILEKRLHDASQSFLEALRIDPTHAESAEALAQLYDSNTCPQKAEEALSTYNAACIKEEMKSLNEDFGEKRWELCLKRCEKLLSKESASLTQVEKLGLLFKAATACYEMGNVHLAIKHANQSIALNPYFLPGLKSLSRFYTAKGEHIKAAGCIGQSAAVELKEGADKNSVTSLYLEAAVIALQANDKALASRYVDKGLKLLPSKKELLEIKTQFLLEEGDFKGAKKAYENAGMNGSRSKKAAVLIEFINLLQKHTQKPTMVRQICLEALALKPDSIEGLTILLSLAKEEARFGEALDTLLKLSAYEKFEKRKIRMLESARDIAKGLSETALSRVLQCYFANRDLSTGMTNSMVLTFRELIASYDKNGDVHRIPDLYDWVLSQLPKGNPAKMRIENDRKHLDSLVKKKKTVAPLPVKKNKTAAPPPIKVGANNNNRSSLASKAVSKSKENHQVFVSSTTTMFTPPSTSSSNPPLQLLPPQKSATPPRLPVAHGKKASRHKPKFHEAKTAIKNVHAPKPKRPRGKKFGQELAEISTVIVKRKATA